jgi:hypothetical protein
MASLLAELSEPETIRKEMMGHRNIATTQWSTIWARCLRFPRMNGWPRRRPSPTSSNAIDGRRPSGLTRTDPLLLARSDPFLKQDLRCIKIRAVPSSTAAQLARTLTTAFLSSSRAATFGISANCPSPLGGKLINTEPVRCSCVVQQRGRLRRRDGTRARTNAKGGRATLAGCPLRNGRPGRGRD